MSLASTLRPVGLSLRRGKTSADSTQSIPFHHEPNYLNLHRTLLRFQHLILLTPSPSSETQTDLSPLQKQIQAELWSPLPYGRNTWLQNIEGLRTLLLQLERQAQGIRVQRAKFEAVKDLAEKRSMVKKLRTRVEEIGREVELMGTENYKPLFEDDQGETLFDVLVVHEQAQHHKEKEDARGTQINGSIAEKRPLSSVRENGESLDTAKSGLTQDLFSPAQARRRNGKKDATAASPSARTTGFSNLQTTERSLLDSSRVQEDITTSLIGMTAQLKRQSQAMKVSLDQDKDLVSRALDGLDLSITSMESASRNMAFLKRMSEEEGWLGRMKLYAMIFGMWIIAFLLVFVSPKLRF